MAANTIDLTTAIHWISTWRTNPDTGVKAFFIPKDDLTDLMNDTTCVGVRAYLAFGNEDGLPAESKLLLVDVDDNGTSTGADNLNNGIYDFTKPCPSNCDVNSPLYTLVNDGSRPPVGGNMISLDDAISWITAWRANPDTGVKAFFIPKSDITDLLADARCIGARAYLAWGTPDSDPAEPKLILVNVEGDITRGGNDIIMNGIYDFTKPCPSNCDVTSQLYTLIQQQY
jgi:hypothetical protein